MKNVLIRFKYLALAVLVMASGLIFLRFHYISSDDVNKEVFESGEEAPGTLALRTDANTEESEKASEKASEKNTGEASDEAANDQVFVHVCGAVVSPGVYSLDPGDRISDAVDAAGGFSEMAARDYRNLAEKLSDGMQVYIPTLEEAGTMPAQAAGGVAAEYDAAAGKININTATETELTALSGIGQTRAKAIVSYREEHGPFGSTEDIMQVPGIKEASYEKIKDDITV